MRETNFVIVGHIDHGKSSLLGRLFVEFGKHTFPEDKIVDFQRNGFANVLDSLIQEKEGAMTINSVRVPLRLKQKKIVFFDMPGHQEFIDRLISMAGVIDGAVVVVDIFAGMEIQTRRQLYILKLFKINKILLVVNKIDLVESDLAERFTTVVNEVKEFCQKLGIEIVGAVPVSVKKDYNIVSKEAALKWYQGETLVEEILKLNDLVEKERESLVGEEERNVLLIQDVYEDKEWNYKVCVGKCVQGEFDLKEGESLKLIDCRNDEKLVVVEDLKNSLDKAVLKIQKGDLFELKVAKDLLIDRGDVLIDAGCRSDLCKAFFRVKILFLSVNDGVLQNVLKVDGKDLFELTVETFGRSVRVLVEKIYDKDVFNDSEIRVVDCRLRLSEPVPWKYCLDEKEANFGLFKGKNKKGDRVTGVVVF